MNAIVQTLNTAGRAFLGAAVPMLIQSSLLILILLAVDAVLRKRVRAVFRYWIWMLVLVKLVLPPSLWSPVSVGTWVGETLEVPAAALLEAPPLPSLEEQGQDARATRLSPAVAKFLSPLQPVAVAPPLPEPTVAPPAPAPAPVASQAAPINRLPALSLKWQGLVLLVWAGVVTALLLLLAQRTFFVRGLVAQAEEASRALRHELDRCRQHLGVRGPASMRFSPNVASPVVCGLWRPVILIPQNLASRLHGAGLQAVLFHELAHLKRGDLWINLVQTILQILYFYNPLLWLANALIRRIREKAVDETVLVAMGEAAPQYPDTLINVAKLALARRPGLSLRLIGVVESQSALTSRIKHILNRPLPKTAKLGALGLATIALIAAILLPMARGKDRVRPLNAGQEQVMVVRWAAVIEGDAAPQLFSNAQPLASESKLFQAAQMGSDDLLRGVKDCMDGNHVLCLLEDLTWMQPSPKDLRKDSWFFFKNLEHPVYSQCGAFGIGRYRLAVSRSKAKLDLQCENDSVVSILNPRVFTEGSIVFQGSLPPGQALAFAGPMQDRRQTVATYLVVYQAVRVPEESLERVRSIRSTIQWIREGPSLLLTRARIPLPTLTAHQYYRVGEPIWLYLQSKPASRWKPNLDEIYHDPDDNPWIFLIDGKEYGCRLGFGPFDGGGGAMEIFDNLYFRPGDFRLPVGRHTVAYGWKNLEGVDPNDPDHPIHFARLATDPAEFEVVEQLPADYYRPVYQEGWEDILRRSIQTPFTDDWHKHGVGDALLTLSVNTLPFDIAFEVYAQAEGSEQRQHATQVTIKAGSFRHTIGCSRNVKGLDWDTVGDKRWRLILVPSQKAAAEHPPIHEFYAREFVTDWLSFERSPQFEQNRLSSLPRPDGPPHYGGTIKADRPVDLDILGRRWGGQGEAWPLPTGFELGWSPDNGGTLRIDPNSGVRLLWLSEADARLANVTAEGRQRLVDLPRSRTTQILPPKGEPTLMAVLSSEGKVYFVTVSKVNETWANLRWEEDREATRRGTTVASDSPEPKTVPSSQTLARLPNGVTVELLGACDFPSEGKQWWRPDGTPLAEAPYDRRGAWVFPNDWDKTPFELALRVRNLPENWEAAISTPDNAWSNAADPPYKAGRRVPELRWLMMEAEPNQTTCTTRCNLAAPWQTVARSSLPLAPSQPTPGDAVVFSEVREGFAGGRVTVSGRDSSGEGVSVTVTGRVGGHDDGWLFGVGGLQRIVAITKDGKTQQAPSDGFYFTEAVGRATAYFPRFSLANVKEFQFQTRALTRVEFRNVPLRRGLQTDVKIEVHSGDTVADVAPSSGTQRERETVLPEADRQPVILDLATGELTPLPPVGPEPEKMQQALRKLGKGDLLYDCDLGDRTLILLRDATSEQAQEETGELSIKGHLIGQRLPEVLTVKIAEGRQYRITILAANDNACTLKYSVIPADKGAGGGALAAPEKEGGILAFRIAPKVEEVGADLVEKYTQALTRGGRPPDNDFAWFEVRPGTTGAPYQITCEHNGKTYVLLWNDQSHVMRPDGTWGLEDVREAPVEMGTRAITLTLDEKGIQLLHALGDANLRHSLAVVFEGRVIAIPFISTTLSGPGLQIIGRFTAEETKQIVAGLKKVRAQPQSQSTEPTASGTATPGSVRGSADPAAALKRLLVETQPGGVVTVPKGRYTTPVEITKAVTLRGESVEGCVIEVTADQPALLVNTQGQGQVTIENLTIRWQLAGNEKAELPASLWVKGTNVLIRNCRFAPLGDFQRSAMAVYIDRPSKSTVDNCRFSGFDYVVCYGQGTEGVVQDCLITDCGHQGVIGYDGSTLTVQRNIITGSRFHAVRCTGGILHVRDNLLIKNANRAIYLGNRTGQGTITNNLIVGNGSGISGFGRANYVIANNVIVNNSFSGIDMRDSCRFSIRNNVLVKNQRGLALFKEGTENFNVIGKNAFWANATDVESLEKPAGSITADPQFADPNHGDFTVQGAARAQEHGPTNPQILKDLWQRYEQLRTPAAGADRPQTSAHDATPSAPQELSGRVVDSDGRPVAGAQVALSTEKIEVSIENGRLEQPRTSDSEKGQIVETDAQGRFRFAGRPPDSFDLIAAQKAGFARVTSDEFNKSHEIRLEKWGRIEGQLAQGRDAVENQIWMASLPNSTWLQHRRQARYETRCDAEGKFTFDQVPAGWFEVGCLTKTGDFTSSHTSRTPVVVQAGATATVRLGGEGRPVIGRFVPPADYQGPVYFGAGLRSLQTAHPDRPRPANYDQMTRRQQQEWLKQWSQTPEARAYSDKVWHDPNWRAYVFRIKPDGTFRIEDVIAGRYTFTVWLEEKFSSEGRPEEIGSYSGTMEVPPMNRAYTDEPLDLGDLTLKMRRPLHVGDMAPLFETKTLDGKDVRLSDYRGRFVLLSFWQPSFHPEVERLRELYQTYGRTGELAIIDFGGWDTLQEVQKYIAEHTIEWPEIYLGENPNSELVKQYGNPVASYILLADPQGKIVATWLRGEKLTEAVEKAIPQPAPLPASNRPSGVAGQVVDPNGQPVTGAQVALGTKDKGVSIFPPQLLSTSIEVPPMAQTYTSEPFDLGAVMLRKYEPQ